jgi:hypothetical protein
MKSLQHMKVVRKPAHYWDNVQNQRQFFDQAAIQLQIKEPKDWFQVKVNDIVQLGGVSLLKKYNKSLCKGNQLE